MSMPSSAGLPISQNAYYNATVTGQVHVLREHSPFCASPSGSSIIDGHEDCVFTEFSGRTKHLAMGFGVGVGQGHPSHSLSGNPSFADTG